MKTLLLLLLILLMIGRTCPAQVPLTHPMELSIQDVDTVRSILFGCDTTNKSSCAVNYTQMRIKVDKNGGMMSWQRGYTIVRNHLDYRSMQLRSDVLGHLDSLKHPTKFVIIESVDIE